MKGRVYNAGNHDCNCIFICTDDAFDEILEREVTARMQSASPTCDELFKGCPLMGVRFDNPVNIPVGTGVLYPKDGENIEVILESRVVKNYARRRTAHRRGRQSLL